MNARNRRSVAGIALLLALALAIPRLGLPTFYVSLLTQTWIYGIAAMALDLLIGFTGLVSFTQAAFFGTGAYLAAIGTTKLHITDFGTILVLSVVAAVVLALAFGAIALRSEGVGFIIITLALDEIVWGLAYQWVSISGGDSGITGFTRPHVGPFDVSQNTAFYYLCLAALLVSLALLSAVVRSPLGLALTGIRERPQRMAALGYNVWLFRYLAFLISAAFAGLAGALFAYYNEFAGPVDLSLATATQLIIMVILGGTGTLAGPILGAGIIVFLSNALSGFTHRWVFILGAVYVVIVMYAPDGIVGLGKRIAAKMRREAAPAPALPITHGEA